ncbi:BREX-1 system adenine-specific DNA-methyltransferase PglX, partial [Ruminococcus sp.]|uniref:BREX-1 system adenine-specific DNA-methyltransferase PglX n=1 Tax=Ruminococcus sp. TaxID=41978 RepID=UPI002590FB34
HEKTSDYKTAYETVVEEIAYTWFNRLIAIRFMEVNDYLPSGVRVLSSESGKREPDIVTQAVEVAEDQGFAISKDDIWRLKDENKLDELFRIMFIAQCKKLNDVLPELFDNSQDDYTELLLPISFIDDDAFIRHLVTDIDEADFNLSEQGQVEIIGWLYQYYNSEKKDAVFAAMSNKVKVSKENIAAATQLFTPDWIVRYMVENSLGRLYIDSRKKEGINADGRGLDELTWDEYEEQRISVEKSIAEGIGWKYYLPTAAQSREVSEQLNEIQANRGNFDITKICFIDPCMGSGHILVYAFDVLMQIYLSCGYTERDAAQNIVRYNLWGLDLDKRAYQLAYFAVMMKARQYDRRFLGRGIRPNLSHFQDLPIVNYSLLDEPIKSFVEQFENADTYGSLITVQANDSITEALKNYDQRMLIGSEKQIEHQINLYKILSQRYDVVCTNPPYMGKKGMNDSLKSFVEDKYRDSKADLFACFIEKCSALAKKTGYYSMITQQTWMFLTSYTELRKKLLNETTINMIHLGARAFDEISGEVVQTTAFVQSNNRIPSYNVIYHRLISGNSEAEKESMFLAKSNAIISTQENYHRIPESPIAYWVSDRVFEIFDDKKLYDYGRTCQGLATADNPRFLRLWFECPNTNIYWNCESHEDSQNSSLKWYPCTKGGTNRKWYGNHDYVVNWQFDGSELKAFKASVIRNPDYYFKEGYSWSTLSGDNFSMRFSPKGFVFESKGSKCFIKDNDKLYYILGLLNSCVVKYTLTFLAPSLDYHEGPVSRVPVIIDESKKNAVETIVMENIALSIADWDSCEVSWDFKKHPFVRSVATIKEAYEQWEQECNDRRAKLKANEEELNRIFIEIYGLQDELTPEVDDKDITVRAADLQRDMRSFVSYAVGCMFGRYSLNVEGLAYAGGEWDESKYRTFIPDKENCLPITEEHFFEDDIVTQFANFVQAVFGEDTLEDNLRYIAENLGIKGNGTAREKIRQYFLKEFYKDHCKVYQKRPIYWLFDTGKKNGFKALCYMHRWNVNTVGNVRIDYMHKLQRLYRNEIIRLQENIDNGEEIAKSQKRLEKVTNQLQETEEYDAKIGIVVAARTEIDLDDGVKVNYDKVQVGSDGKHYQILAKI